MEIIKQINKPCDHHHHSGHPHEHSNKEGYPPDGITSNIHDGALVCSGNKQLTGDLEQVRQNLTHEIELLDKWVDEQEGITGHIKAIISVNGPAYRLSSTGGEVESKKLELKNIHVSVVAIVFQVDQETMEHRIESLFAELTEGQ